MSVRSARAGVKDSVTGLCYHAAMGGMLKLLGVIFGTIFGLVIFTQYEAGSFDAVTRVFDIPVISLAHVDAYGLIAIGQVAKGVIVIAQGGLGVVTFAQGGVGVLFGIGQGMVGMFAVAQLGIGISFFMGQVGGGIQAMGQGVFGKSMSSYAKEMNAEIASLLSYRAE